MIFARKREIERALLARVHADQTVFKATDHAALSQDEFEFLGATVLEWLSFALERALKVEQQLVTVDRLSVNFLPGFRLLAQHLDHFIEIRFSHFALRSLDP